MRPQHADTLRCNAPAIRNLPVLLCALAMATTAAFAHITGGGAIRGRITDASGSGGAVG